MPYAPDETVADAIKRAGLPTSHRIHWSKSRKAEVVRAVRDNRVRFEDVRDRYLLSQREFREWEQQVDGPRSGVPANLDAERELLVSA